MTVEHDDNYRLIGRSLYQRQLGVWIHVMRFDRDVKLAEAIALFEGEE